jgi:crotonobetainyl-CoA:carnitine CoA-transferase CaiB-like acyl-CoA transferase
MPGALGDIRVVDVTSTFMGPYCTMLLGQWGADVITVEPPGGDVVRYVGDVHGTGLGPVFLNTNRGKRSIVVDLKEPDGQRVLRQLVSSADVFVHNLRSPSARRLGVAGAALAERHPRLIVCEFQGFGDGGPYAGHPAYDDIIQGMSGMADLQRDTGEPAYVRSSIVDKIVGVMGAAAILAALHERDRTGAGQLLQMPMLESITSFTLLEQQGGRVFDPPRGPAGYARTSAPNRRPYATADGYISVVIYTDAQWRAFFELIGEPELAADPRYATITQRTLHVDELYGRVDREMRTATTAEWLERLPARGIAAGAVKSLDDLFTDPQLTATGFFEPVDHPVEGRLLLARPPGPLAADRAGRGIAPRLGEHTDAILRELAGETAGPSGDG